MSNETFQAIKADVARTLRVVHGNSEAFEVRVLGYKVSNNYETTYAGYYDSDRIEDAAVDVAKAWRQSPNTYVTLNPIKTACLARSKTLSKAKEAVKDEDVTRRRWLLIDFDPKRVSGISATDEEKKAAFDVAVEVRDWLRDEQDFRDPVCADSGNGYHLLYPIDLPNDADSLELIGKVLHAVAKEYTDENVDVDVTVGNASRITKLYGTYARKGADMPEQGRPHRRSKLEKVPEDLGNGWTAEAAVSREQLAKVAALHADSFGGSGCGKSGSGKPDPGERYDGGGELKEQRCWAYLQKLPPSVSGQKGSGKFFRAACVCVEFDLDEQQGMRMLRRWSDEFADPAWSEKEIAGKWKDANKEAERGAKLEDGDNEPDPDVIAAIVIPPGTVAQFNQSRQERFNHLLNDCVVAPTNQKRNAKIKLLCWAIGDRIEIEFLWSQIESSAVFEDRAEFDTVLAAARSEWQRQQVEERTTEQGLTEGSPPEAFAAEFLAENPMHQNDGEWYIWKFSNYEPITSVEAQRQVVTKWLIDTYPGIGVTARLTGDVLGAVKALATTARGRGTCYWVAPDQKEVDWNLKDCLVTPTQIVKLETGETHPRSSGLFCSTAIATEFNRDAKECPLWEKTLRLWWGHDPQCIQALQEWFGYCLAQDTSLQKILYIKGTERSGKGTIAHVITQLLGLANIAALKARTFSDPHGMQVMVGKPVGICGDARFSRKENAAVVESLLSISGEDSQYINPKGVAAYSTKLPTRLMLLSNDLPNLKDDRGVLTTRMIFLIQTVSFLGKEDTDLKPKLDQELPAILNWAIEGYRRLKARGKFEEPASSESTRAVMGETVSPIKTFVDTYCVVEPGARQAKCELYQGYRNFLVNHGSEHTPQANTFARMLISVVPGLDVKQKMRAGEVTERNEEIQAECKAAGRDFKYFELKGRPPVYVGVRLKTAEELAEEEVQDLDAPEEVEEEHDDVFNYLFNLDNPGESVRALELEGKDTTLLIDNIIKSGYSIF